MRKKWLIAALALVMGGCGYRLLSVTPQSCGELFLAPVQERGEELGLALPLREQLSKQLVARGAVLTVAPKGDVCTVHAVVNNLQNSMSGSGYGEQKVNSFTQKATAECWISDKNGRLFSSGPIKLQEIFLASPDLADSQVEILATESARRRNLEILAQKLATECLDRAEEKWLQ